eukprot:5115751-Pyramimonas_sp.AAC.1
MAKQSVGGQGDNEDRLMRHRSCWRLLACEGCVKRDLAPRSCAPCPRLPHLSGCGRNPSVAPSCASSFSSALGTSPERWARSPIDRTLRFRQARICSTWAKGAKTGQVARCA